MNKSIPAKFKCTECAGDGNLALSGNSGGEWLVDCPACCGTGLTEEGFEYKMVQDKIKHENELKKEKYEKAMAETRQNRNAPTPPDSTR